MKTDKKGIKIGTIVKAMNGGDELERMAAAKLCLGKQIEHATLASWGSSGCWWERLAAIYATPVKDRQLSSVLGAFRMAPEFVRVQMLRDFAKMNLPLTMYQEMLLSSNLELALSVAKLLEKVQVEQSQIRHWFYDSDVLAERVAAMYASVGSLVPGAWLYAGMKTGVAEIVDAAVKATKHRGFDDDTIFKWWEKRTMPEKSRC